MGFRVYVVSHDGRSKMAVSAERGVANNLFLRRGGRAVIHRIGRQRESLCG